MDSKKTKSKSRRHDDDECPIKYLPGDLTERIFPKLPADTLLRCTRVSKHWQAFIRNPQFATSHLQHAPRCALLFFPQETVSGKLYPSDAVIIDETWSQSTHAVPVIGPDDFLFGSCNGLIGLYTKTSTIKIANFFTSECFHIEKPAKTMRGDHFSSYSFGFHPVTKEYKITHFLGDYSEGRSQTNKDIFNIIQVYKLGDDNWKDIEAPEPLSLNCVRTSGVVNLDGTLYWLTKGTTASQKHSLVFFDLGEETFSQIQLPNIMEEDNEGADGPRQYWIRDIEGKVCVATARTCTYQPRMPVGKVQIWALDKNLEQNWIHKYNIYGSYHYILGPNFVHGDKSLTQYTDFSVYTHEFLGETFEIGSSNMVRLLDFSPRRAENIQCYTCVKSFVPLDAYKKAAIVRKPKHKDGWKLKKWESWERELSNVEEKKRYIYTTEQTLYVTLKKLDTMFQSLGHPPYHIRQRVCTEFNAVYRYMFLDAPIEPKAQLRLNWVDQKRNNIDVMTRFTEINERAKIINQAYNIMCIIDNYMKQHKAASTSLPQP